jgi:hypothetical protein
MGLFLIRKICAIRCLVFRLDFRPSITKGNGSIEDQFLRRRVSIKAKIALT